MPAPTHPNLAAAALRIEALQADYLADYEYDDGEGGGHSPSELEQLLIEDAINGLLSSEGFIDALTDWRLIVRSVIANDRSEEHRVA